MSVEALNWAFKQVTELPVDKLILLSIADLANEDAQAWPSRKLLAERGMCSMDTVDRSIARMEEAGILSKEKRPHPAGGLSSSCYTIVSLAPSKPRNVAPSPQIAATPRSRKHAPTVAADCGHPSRTDAATLAAQDAATGTTIEPSEVPPKAPKGAAMPILEAFDLWNAKALELGLPQAATLSPARRRSIGARLREAGGMDGWRKMLAEVARSSFLLGRKDGCDFRADLDFVLKPSRFPKILDGGYADKDAPAASSAPWWQDPAKVAGMTPERWRRGIDMHANGKWPIMELGPWPGDPKCLVPRELIDELHLTDKYDPRTGLAKGEWAAEQRKRHEAHA